MDLSARGGRTKSIFLSSINTVFTVFLSKGELIVLQLGNKKFKKCRN